MRPSLHQFRIYGPRNGLLLDQDNETLILLTGRRYKSYAEHFLSPLGLAKQYLGNTSRNVRTFLANDFHMKAGMKYLIESFYRSITEGAPLPIPYREIILTARIMDELFEQIKGTPAERRDPINRVSTRDSVCGVEYISATQPEPFHCSGTTDHGRPFRD